MMWVMGSLSSENHWWAGPWSSSDSLGQNNSGATSQVMEACVGTGKVVTKMHNVGELEGTLTYALGSQLAPRAGAKPSWAGER